ncbi:uncharacterized protein AMSG_11875 [Thecamonas trahens ATCC 50062]|uniref:Uncharacterized protein n=1 Tax=Thecamonas trahens ATCC 50062 TaxID=461836 RepID=A0A0L0DAF4_THETB|nr:hypothetical protein AMSG_11875 [Thecamonas trahens ATCC 50062]KNC49339.1 hypothetical protein AMSG_11875 [Thecamonas trahens ATCC 50062]|eukprot:XP_013758073.1 hypothetical protein AMSG_11875 [Thecamonas trahens ATCC 50062]
MTALASCRLAGSATLADDTRDGNHGGNGVGHEVGMVNFDDLDEAELGGSEPKLSAKEEMDPVKSLPYKVNDALKQVEALQKGFAGLSNTYQQRRLMEKGSLPLMPLPAGMLEIRDNLRIVVELVVGQVSRYIGHKLPGYSAFQDKNFVAKLEMLKQSMAHLDRSLYRVVAAMASDADIYVGANAEACGHADFANVLVGEDYDIKVRKEHDDVDALVAIAIDKVERGQACRGIVSKQKPAAAADIPAVSRLGRRRVAGQ